MHDYDCEVNPCLQELLYFFGSKAHCACRNWHKASENEAPKAEGVDEKRF